MVKFTKKFINWFKTKTKRALDYYKKYGLWLLFRDKVLDKIVAKYWATKPIWTPKKLFINQEKVEINKPIFLLGVPGAGLTLVSRIISRNTRVVTIGRNSSFWAGANDEMHHQYQDLGSNSKVLRKQIMLKASKKKGDEDHPIFGYYRTNIYATNELFDKYRCTTEDFTENFERLFKKIIKRSIIAHAHDVGKARFLDKSQSFSLKVPCIRKALKKSKPKFLIILRNPYAWCWKSAFWQKSSFKRWQKSNVSDEERLRYFAQSWFNNYKTAIEDLADYKDHYVIRFEDVLANPKSIITKVFQCGILFVPTLIKNI
jgi:adenylate kinase family enzyme